MGTREDAGRRSVPLPGNRTLVVRPATRADVPALEALYGELDDEARYRRFFSMYRPNREFLERMATAAERGGYELLAIVRDDRSGEERVIAEAGYTISRKGVAELAITVAEAWRGWVGAYLLDALVDAAAARGVDNLRAEVLVANRPMLALARSRGYATVGHPDWTIVSLLIGTHGRTPTWPERDGPPRVLVEVPGGRWPAEQEARAAGLDVVVCPGPREYPARCPALDGEPCPLATHADAIVVVPPAGDSRWQALLESHASLHAGVPVLVERRPGPPTAVALLQRIVRGRQVLPARADT